MNNFDQVCEELAQDIQNSYVDHMTMDKAEKLASKFLHVLMQVSEEIRKADMDARMKKTGLKAIKASMYMEAATKGDKKPSDTFLDALITKEMDGSYQNQLDEAEAYLDKLNNYYQIFTQAHIHYRQISKASFAG
jgi:hypothetical protein